MTIPMVIRVKSMFGMSKTQRNEMLAAIAEAYENAKKRGVPLVVGEHCEVLWPVERWEHRVDTYSGLHGNGIGLLDVVRHHQDNGWQVCSCDGTHVVFKRPARADDED